MASLSVWIREQFSRQVVVHVPTEEERRNREETLNAIYLVGAAIVSADGIVNRGEIAAAEQVGALLFEDFDNEKFRQACGTVTDAPTFLAHVDELAGKLTERNKRLIFAYLHRIATSDGNLANSETDILSYIRTKWGIGMDNKG
ncbi:MAG: TerB family tellurite resistance protein [Hyphomicrobiales bacterium]